MHSEEYMVRLIIALNQRKDIDYEQIDERLRIQ